MLKKLLDQIYYRKRGLILKVGKVIKVSGPLVVAEGMEDDLPTYKWHMEHHQTSQEIRFQTTPQ